MNNYDKVLTLIEELQKLRTLGRIFVSYGPIDTLRLAISRFLNNEINDYFEHYLELLDETIIYFNETPYKVNIDRYNLGELYNVSKLDADDDPNEFFMKFFDGLNLIVLEILKAGIDELVDNGVTIKNVNSLRSLANINYRSSHFNYIKDVINEYYNTIINKPSNIISIFSYLKRFRLDTNFISSTVKDLEKNVNDYIKLKYSITQNSSFNVFNQS